MQLRTYIRTYVHNAYRLLGLGQFLHDMDPAKRDWRWHLQHVLMLCRVHFFRKIDEKLGPNPDFNIWRNAMKSLVDIETYEEYKSLLQWLQGKQKRTNVFTKERTR